MWRPEVGGLPALPDVQRFVDMLQARDDFFVADAPLIVARAPGRLDLMGGIADYSGALVLELPLGAATLVAAQVDREPMLTVWSTTVASTGEAPVATIPLDLLGAPDEPIPYAAARERLHNDAEREWVAYVAGVLLVLMRERGLRPGHGARLLIHSEVPSGKGVSSSAALEVASMQALAALYGLTLDGPEMAMLCQRAENLVVGAPCGIMDQMTSACGEEGRLLTLLCQPAALEPATSLPPEVEVWGVDSGIRHAVSGADYGSVRIGAFMGYRIIADLAGLAVAPLESGKVRIEDGRWQGYLANIPPSLWESAYRDHVPVELDGATFLARYGGSTDAVTSIDPGRVYAVRQPAVHPIYEHHRVRLFRALLSKGSPDDETLNLLGELMFQSHASYNACGLGSEGTDRLVEMVREAGPQAGLFGAKITGGGSGGTVAVLARRGAKVGIERIAAEYERETGRPAMILGDSSPGAVEFGTIRLVNA